MTGRLHIDRARLSTISREFLSVSIDNEQTIATIRDFHSESGYLLDPHPATGIKAAKSLSRGDFPVVCLATAHPAKFPDAVKHAIGHVPDRPANLKGLEQREKRSQVIAADTATVKSFLASNALS
ncbi:MAG: hypothetical protein P8Y96_10145 [Desulfuromonadales bacterium]